MSLEQTVNFNSQADDEYIWGSVRQTTTNDYEDDRLCLYLLYGLEITDEDRLLCPCLVLYIGPGQVLMLYRNAFHVLCSDAQHLDMQARGDCTEYCGFTENPFPASLRAQAQSTSARRSKSPLQSILGPEFLSRYVREIIFSGTRKDAAHPSCGMANKWVFLFVVQQQIHE